MELWPQVDALDRAIDAQDVDSALELLEALVPGGKEKGHWSFE